MSGPFLWSGTGWGWGGHPFRSCFSPRALAHCASVAAALDCHSLPVVPTVPPYVSVSALLFCLPPSRPCLAAVTVDKARHLGGSLDPSCWVT